MFNPENNGTIPNVNQDQSDCIDITMDRFCTPIAGNIIIILNCYKTYGKVI